MGKDVILGLLPPAELAAPLVAHVLGPLEERVVDQHLTVPTTLHVLVQALVDEVLEVGAPLGRYFGWLVLHNVEQNARVML